MFTIVLSLFRKTTLNVYFRYKTHNFSTSICAFSKYSRQYRSLFRIKKKLSAVTNVEGTNDSDFEEIDEEFNKYVNKKYLTLCTGHQIYVIQPYIKFGVHKKRNTTPELQLLESITLIKTLRNWKVVKNRKIGLSSFKKLTVFGKGNLKEITNEIRGSNVISAVFISINRLSMSQQSFLQEAFNVPVFDRYTIIMHIFREHAQTKEAKLQVQLAQIPYLWSVLNGVNEGFGEKLGFTGNFTGGEGLKPIAERAEALRRREAKLKKQILELRENRQRKRENRIKNEIPVVAVLGYTNAGKTSLIKVLTGKKSLEPQDYLFATLDVTSYLGILPSGLKVYFIDTLGFINDIPTYLIESFRSTLEDAELADVILHIRDISHPDTVSQNDNVLQTLKGLNLPEKVMENIITVGNKIDLVEKEKLDSFKDMILISCSNLTGIDKLKSEIEKKVLQCTDNKKMVIRVESGSEEYKWLYSNSTVINEKLDDKNSNFVLVKVIISDINLSKLKHHFIKNYNK